MKKNFKLFDLHNDSQLLVTRDYNNEDEHPCITISFFVDGAKVEMGIGYQKEASRDKAFDAYEQDDAETMYKGLYKNIFGK